MKYLYLLVSTLTIGISASNYESIHISENKKNLSKEIYSILKRDHFEARFDKTDFNERYIQAIIDKLDKNKNYFTLDEVNHFIEKSRFQNDDDFNIELGYELINLYFKKLILFTEYQIELTKNNSFDAFILAVPHKFYLQRMDFIKNFLKSDGIFFDIKGMLSSKKDKNFNYWSL